MNRVKSFLLILIVLWMPLQTAASWAMPLAMHAGGQPTAAAAGPAHCHDLAQAAAAVPDSAAAGDFDSGCDNCRICHLASAGFLLPPAEGAEAPPAGRVLVASHAPAMPSHIGEPPRHPPRRTN